MFAEVLQNICNPASLLLILGGVVMGNIFGAIPGLNTPIAIALVLPITMVMEPVPTVCLLMGIYMGCVSGGLVSAVLLKIPGTAASVATVFDGYPMAMKGQGTRALTVGVFASFFGGIFSSLMLLILAPVLSKIAITFGPWEYFGASMLALSLVCALARGNMVKGCISLGIGLLARCVGQSSIDGVAYRYSFGSTWLRNGFALVAVVIGVFALPEIINNAAKMKEVPVVNKVEKKIFHILDLKSIKRHLVNLFRSSAIGTMIGILPGLGGGPAALISYAAAKKGSKTPEEFGKGSEEGIVAAESANNATTGGALIPLLSLSVPGDTATAVMMGAMTIQGIAIGPNLSLTQPVLFRSIILAVFVANIFMFLYQSTTLGLMAKIISIPKMYLMPFIAVFCITGIFCLNSNPFDLYYTVGFVILGYLLDKNGYPTAPLIMGMILGNMVEENLRRSIVYYDSFLNCVTRMSVGTAFFAVAVMVPVVMAVKELRGKQKKQKGEA
ncbi:MAG: Tat pathway signal protein [Lachnospiraceae bacterium]|jgi:putative tricarboxylic transport membrane protein|nr:Tat pathway signal protein [Lachnospiraceae bacterium]